MRKFPLFIQHDSMQCGIACLCMICKFYGRSISIETMANLCHANKEGVSLMGLSESATLLGFHTIAAKIGINKLQIIPLPCILHWNQNHFVVLHKIKNNKFCIADPGKGLVTYTLDEFKKHWLSTNANGEDKGIAMFLETTPAFFTHKMEDETNSKLNFRKCQTTCII